MAHAAREVSRIETPLFPVVLVQYSRCRSNSPKSLRTVYSQDCVSTQSLNSFVVVSGPPGTNCLRRFDMRCPRIVPSRMTVHWPSPRTSQPARSLPLNIGFQSAAETGTANMKIATNAWKTTTASTPLRNVDRAALRHSRRRENRPSGIHNTNPVTSPRDYDRAATLPIACNTAFSKTIPPSVVSTHRHLRFQFTNTTPAVISTQP